jgi:hypothetical protein
MTADCSSFGEFGLLLLDRHFLPRQTSLQHLQTLMQEVHRLLIRALITLRQNLSKTSQHLTSIEPHVNILSIQSQRHPVTLQSLPQQRLQVQTGLLDNLRALRELKLQTGFVVCQVEVCREFLQAFVVDLESAKEGSSRLSRITGTPFATGFFFFVCGFLEFVCGARLRRFGLGCFARAGELLSFGHAWWD